MISGNFSTQVDGTFMFVLIISLVLMAGIVFSMIYFIFKYHHSKNQETEDIHGHLGLEVLWTVIPTFLVLAMFYYGLVGYEEMETIPENAMQVEAKGRMWEWQFTYENGAKTDTLYVPKDQPIHLVMTSSDVIHSLYIPELRIKKDVVPGLTTNLWFAADEEKKYDIFCTEYCGDRHAYMLTKVISMPEGEFKTWYQQNAVAEPAPAAQ